MDPLNFDDWDVDVGLGRAKHPCGFQLEVEGDARNPTGVSPANYPPELSFAEQARLLRSGMNALASAAGSGAGRAASARPTTVNRRAKQAEERAKLFAEQRKDRPARAKLSLKKPS
ncbi:hypothetical protein [Marinimicrobium agarilyticum]|uniref:hypothetical protein n=1 Tax=Marinimicrobium agarilyticum TaxID=306546 RepID=UPI00040B3F96|nr:hypothetical protein [Marinimicrobium agarilyticum]